MSPATAGLILAILAQLLFVGLMVALARYLPNSALGKPAKAFVNWMPPFLGGNALREWAADTTEKMVRERLAGERTGEAVSKLATDLEAATDHAMLPSAESADLVRVVACPSTGQGRVGVTIPEVLAVADQIRKQESAEGQKRIHDQALANAQKIANASPEDREPPPCALQGPGHVCCTFAERPLHCRPLHAVIVAREASERGQTAAPYRDLEVGEIGHQKAVGDGVQEGLSRAIKSAGLDAKRYELNSALAIALEHPDAAERWGRGEDVFVHANCLG